jgi:hypothetical protein
VQAEKSGCHERRGSRADEYASGGVNGKVVRQHAGWPAEGKAALSGLIDAAAK